MEQTVQRDRKIGCVLMASGLSRRFGTDKLMTSFQGRSLIRTILDTTAGDLFAARIVLTRSVQAADVCRAQGTDVILHELEGRGDAVRLGMHYLQRIYGTHEEGGRCTEKPAFSEALDGVLFCPCDQPLLERSSLIRMIRDPQFEKRTILRLAYGERCGAPVLFGSAYFTELCKLPQKKGGSYLIGKYPDWVRCSLANREEELWDIDTQEDLERLRQAVQQREV